MKKINISTEYITLGQFLKLAGEVSSGVEAKILIQNGEVLVNGDVEIRRGKKLYNEDIVLFGDKEFMVIHESQ